MSLLLRRSVFAFVLGAALAAAVFLGRSAFATTDTISACFKPSNGTLYLLGDGTGRNACQPGDIPISWNTAGVNGQDGVSVTSAALAPGQDPACPNGGSKFTAAHDAVSYACNGANGRDGPAGPAGHDGVDGQDGASVAVASLAPGDDAACPNGGSKFTAAGGAVSYACNGSNGQDGQNFNGTFTSPNGQYRLIVSDTSARLEGPTGRMRITADGVRVEGALGALNLLTTESSLGSTAGLTLNAGAALALTGGSAVTINGQNNVTLHSQGLFSASGSLTTIGGTPIILNGPGCGLLRRTDVASSVGTDGGTILLNPSGAPNVLTTC